jgi:NADPH:quinone reductase-like Zn-dependent oxidoreductase
MAPNQAAWITAPAAHPFVVKENAKPKPGPGEVVIKNMAVAIVSSICRQSRKLGTTNQLSRILWTGKFSIYILQIYRSWQLIPS